MRNYAVIIVYFDRSNIGMSVMKWDDFYDNIQSSDNAENLFGQIKLYAEKLGFPFVSYVMCVPSLTSVAHWIRF